MQFSIRRAAREDADAVVALEKAFAIDLRAIGVFGESAFSVDAYLRDGFGPDPVFSGLVADTGTDLIGYLLYHWGYETEAAARNLWVMDLYVHRESRRIGVGRALMEEAVRVCREAGGTLVCWSVYPSNAPAFEFYEGIGASYTDDERFMHLGV